MPFVPPKVNQNVWATHVPGRSPEFKVHSSEGLANSAVSYHYPGQTVTKYKLTDGEWKVYEVFQSPEDCDWCHEPFKATRWGRSWNRPYSQIGKVRYEEPVICDDCYLKDRDKALKAFQEKQDLKKLKELQAKYGNH